MVSSNTNLIEVITNGIKKGEYNKTNLINVGIKPTGNNTQNSICLYCVVDVSGSMCSTVTQCEATKISRMDLVVHSLKTIVNSLDDDDQFCLIPFNISAEVLLEETNAKEKEVILEAIGTLYPHGSTDIIYGLNLAIDTLRKTNNNKVNNYIMVFTDGEQSIDYDESLDSLLKKKVEEDDNMNYTISTFTFGYDVDSLLMESMAKIGNGIYGFCPDFTMVGTVFINYLANIKSTLFPSVEVNFSGKDKITSKEFNQTINIGGIYFDTERNAIFDIEDIDPLNIEGEIKVNIIGRNVEITNKWNSNDNDNCKIVDIDKYINEKNFEAQANGLSNEIDETESDDDDNENEVKNKSENETDKSKNEDEDEDDMADSESDDENYNTNTNEIKKSKEDLLIEKYLDINQMDRLLNQVYRYKLLNILKENNNNDINLNNVFESINSLYDELKKFFYRTELMKGIAIDLKSENPNNGQIEKAFNEQFYNQWGRSYLKSFNRYHILEQCGNFKDHSLKPYSGKKFIEKRNYASKIFLSTPLQTTNRNVRERYNNGSGYVSTSTNVDTNAFYYRNGGCFNGDALVKLQQNSSKRVRDLVQGDILSNGCQVRCVVEQPLMSEPMNHNKTKVYTCTVEGVQFSPYHPIYYNDKWCFPCDITKVQSNVQLDSWFNLVLQDDKRKYEVEFVVEKEKDNNDKAPLLSSSLKAITLGHGRNENSILEHPYFGTRKVIKALKNKYTDAFNQGYIKTEITKIQRENQHGIVNEYY